MVKNYRTAADPVRPFSLWETYGKPMGNLWEMREEKEGGGEGEGEMERARGRGREGEGEMERRREGEAGSK
jgi:hypothetical protein